MADNMFVGVVSKVAWLTTFPSSSMTSLGLNIQVMNTLTYYKVFLDQDS